MTDALGVGRPDHEPRATEYVRGMVGMIADSGRQGSRISRAERRRVLRGASLSAGYGKLSGKSLDDLRAGARVEIDESKQDPLDFVLWKAAKPGEPAVGFAVGQGPARLAHRVFRDERGIARRALRHPRRRSGPAVPAPRERDRPVRRRARSSVRELLDAQRLRAGGQREDVEVARQLLHRARDPREVRSRGGALLHSARPLPQPAQLFRPASRRRDARR